MKFNKWTLGLTIAFAVALPLVSHAQTSDLATNAAALSQAQVQQVNAFVDGLLPLIPQRDIPIAGKIIGYLGLLAVAGRFLKGYLVTGNFGDALWHFVAGIFFNHTPTPPDQSQMSQGAGASKLRGVGLMLCLGLMALAFTGCKSEQMLSNTTGNGANIHLIVPIPGTTTSLIEASLQMGIYKNTSLIQPTSSNKVYTASVAITSKTRQADTIAGGTGVGTNATASVASGAQDVNVLTVGSAGVTDGTNAMSATSNQ